MPVRSVAHPLGAQARAPGQLGWANETNSWRLLAVLLTARSRTFQLWTTTIMAMGEALLQPTDRLSSSPGALRAATTLDTPLTLPYPAPSKGTLAYAPLDGL